MELSTTAKKILQKLTTAGSPLTTAALQSLLPSTSAPDLIRAVKELSDRGFVEKTPLGVRSTSRRPLVQSPAEHGGQIPVTPTPQSTPQSRWDQFRRLCRFYAECARLEERGAIQVRADAEGDHFLNLSGKMNLDGFSSAGGMILSSNDELDRFVGSAKTRKRHPSLFLGGPLAVTVAKDRDTGEIYRLVRPIFVAQVVARQLPMGVQFSIPADRVANPGGVEVNHRWLESRFRDAAERKEFLANVGLLSPEEWDEEEESPRSLRTVSLAEATMRLRTRYPSWWKESGDFTDPPEAPRLDRVKESGVYCRLILVQQQELKYGGRLYKELMKLADQTSDEDLDQTALRWLFPHSPRVESSAIPSNNVQAPMVVPPPSLKPINPEQTEAIRRSLTERLLVVTGPPGTGKSVVVQHAMIANALAGQSVLFASRNHEALRAVVPGLNAVVEPEQLVCWPGQRSDGGARGEWFRVMAALLARPRRNDVLDVFEAAKTRLADAQNRLNQAESAVSAWIDTRSQLADLEQTLADAEELLGGGTLARAGTAHTLPPASQLRQLIKDLEPRGSPGLLGAVLRPLGWLRTRRTTRRAKQIHQQFTSAFGTESIPPITTADGQTRLIDALTRWARVADVAAQLRQREDLVKRVKNGPAPKTTLSRLQQSRARLEACTREALLALSQSAAASISPERRKQFAELSAALQNASGAPTPRQLRMVETALRGVFPVLLQKFPLWTVTNLSAHSVLPFAPASFDLVVIDEASQCDIGSVVPLLFRAKRAMVVGDPMQLRHVAQIAADVEYRLRDGMGLAGSAELERYSHRVNSMYQLAASSLENRSPVELVGHFRCHPDIAAFMNSAFYNRTLDVLTNEHALLGPAVYGWRRTGCEWVDVTGSVVGASSGCHCPAEADAILNHLRALEASNYKGTVGVVTPFRVQANRISDKVTSSIRRETLDRWRFVASTADAFQGGERDLILFSLSASDEMPAGSRMALSGSPNRFNVATSRARALLRIVGNRQWAAGCAIPHIQALLRACEVQERAVDAPIRTDLIGPVWEPKFAAALRDAGLPVRQQYHSCGRFLDIALLRDNLKLDIEVDGECHRDVHGRRRLDDVYRDQLLEAAGWTVERFWVYQLREDFDACLKRVQSLWNG